MTKLANLVQRKRVLLFCLRIGGAGIEDEKFVKPNLWLQRAVAYADVHDLNYRCSFSVV